jgi:hypothetical protein
LNGKIKYEFSAVLWQHPSQGGWFFATLPEELSIEIRQAHQWEEEGWGRLKSVSKIGDSEWKTAIWFDTKKKAYLLPVKADVRRNERIDAGEHVRVILWI